MELDVFKKDKVIIAGGRDFTDYTLLDEVCSCLVEAFPTSEVVSGGASGADALGEQFAKEYGYKLTQFPADWDAHGKRAGFIRNTEMANYADRLIAFWDNKSNGTRHMIGAALSRGIPVHVIPYTNIKVDLGDAEEKKQE